MGDCTYECDEICRRCSTCESAASASEAEAALNRAEGNAISLRRIANVLEAMYLANRLPEVMNIMDAEAMKEHLDELEARITIGEA